MEFTFGIITDGRNDGFIYKIIESIIHQKIENYEIIIVGNTKIKSNINILQIDFDENIKNGWITKKKNIISEKSKYENIVFIHDYVIFDKNWYEGFKKFGNDFEMCVSKIKNFNGERFRDYTFFPNYFSPQLSKTLISYHIKPKLYFNKYRYISGTYYIIKKNIALKYKLNEELCHCQSEDIELCERLSSNNILLDFNPHSEVVFLKSKMKMIWEKNIDDDFVNDENNFQNWKSLYK